MKKLLPIVIVLISLSCASKNKQVSTSKATPPAKTEATKQVSAKPAKTAATAAATPEVTKGGITVVKSVACRSVENRNPVGEGASFPTNVGRVYLFTQLKVAAGNGSIEHIWHHNGKEVAKVTLPINGAAWRTYSSKSIDASSKGDWKVDVATAKGEVIQSTEFKVE